jgi:hypothetical protein
LCRGIRSSSTWGAAVEVEGPLAAEPPDPRVPTTVDGVDGAVGAAPGALRKAGVGWPCTSADRRVDVHFKVSATNVMGQTTSGAQGGLLNPSDTCFTRERKREEEHHCGPPRSCTLTIHGCTCGDSPAFSPMRRIFAVTTPPASGNLSPGFDRSMYRSFSLPGASGSLNRKWNAPVAASGNACTKSAREGGPPPPWASLKAFGCCSDSPFSP